MQHDSQLCFRSHFVAQAKNITIFYENGDVFNGFLSRGKRHGFGMLSEFSTGSVYNGNWEFDTVCNI
jgi:hypothetical protein